MTATAHAHRWSAMRFEIADGHPWVVETCSTCGTARRYRAFERFWDPASDAGERRREAEERRPKAG